MSELNPLLSDLALILIVAGITTLVFKALKQPLVLGYVIAGILAGPYIDFFPTASEIESVEFWGKIGVVFLLFGLGLEFSFKKIKKVGGAGFITVFLETVMMFCMGFLVGKILGWGQMSSLFLGGMLSISSTSIIIKAFDDLGLKNKKFTQLVFGVLVVEDMVAILLLVLLPTFTISHAFNGSEILEKILNLSLFLLLWFTGGIFFIPTLFKKLSKFLTDETLIVVSLGLCLMMVVITVNAGISEALGAFVMGSILAGTAQSEMILKLTKPIKDFFGAIFFVSVGMLVNPHIIVEYWYQILLITIVILVAKPISATIGLLFSGQTLKIALLSGMCLCQIGEFSFIIASVGRDLKVTQEYMYPVIVAVSVLTTFITPYWMKLAEPLYNFIFDHVKPQWRVVIERLGTGRKTLNRENEWHKLLKSYCLRLFVYCGWLSFVFVFFINVVNPLLSKYLGGSFESKLLQFSLTILAMMPFLYGLLKRKDSDGIFDKIWADKKFARGPLLSMMIIKYIIAVFAISITVSYYLTRSSAAILIICAFVIIVVVVSNKIKKYYGKIEDRFLTNLNSDSYGNFVMPRELADELHIDKCSVGVNSFLAGKTISEVHRAKKTGALIIRIDRGGQIIDLPMKTHLFLPGDHLILLGTDSQIQDYRVLTKESFRESDNKETDMELFQITLSAHSVLIGSNANISHVRERFGVLLVGVEKSSDNTFIRPTSAIVIEPGDTVWVVGCKEKIKALD